MHFPFSVKERWSVHVWLIPPATPPPLLLLVFIGRFGFRSRYWHSYWRPTWYCPDHPVAAKELSSSTLISLLPLVALESASHRGDKGADDLPFVSAFQIKEEEIVLFFFCCCCFMLMLLMLFHVV